ncbi:MAG TPA: BTAD domain-containing putative transcriptional regulator [Candidatus Limnocylindrales bacterium]|nr:BTAD domain-containing putative transcriptional regulator [Candidatus Limnocylindrales bacterium]
MRVWDGARWAGINAPHHRIVLSVLLAEPGRAVPRDRLINDIWGERPTRTAGSAVNGYVMRLRRLLRAGEAADLVTHSAGYELVTADDDTVDARSFERFLDEGKRYASQGRMADAADNLGSGLALWRGPALADVPSTAIVSAEAARLDQLRLAAWEERLAAQLELGQHAAIAEELETLVREHPLRERLCAYLMIALYRCGRRVEALEAYRRVRSILAEETGLEPGPQLRDLELAVLNDDQSLAAPTVRPVTPAQLPAAVTDFTGRQPQLERLNSLALQGTPAIVTISGLAGVGKTALAVHWAHSVRDRFPDGQLYIDMQAYSDRPPVAPMEALAHFLQALGVDPQRIPREVEEAAGLYRSLLAGKRILVVLDNAGHPDHVRRLLPGGPGCAVVVTGRDQLRGLTAREGALSISLGVLRPDEAHDLLRTLLDRPAAGTERNNQAAMEELARLCGYLPLAIRIAVANLRARLTSIDAYNRRLAAGDRLAALGVDGDAVAATANAFGLSYRARSPAAQRLFRLLSIAPGDTASKEAAAALAVLPMTEAEHLLEALATAHLLEPVATGRYGFHNLVRLYARRLCLERDDDQDEALCRLYDHYLSTVDAAVHLLYPHVVRLPLTVSPKETLFGDREEALRWLEAERANLVAAVLAAGPAQREAAWRLTDCLRWHLDFTAPSVDWMPVSEAALDHAREHALSGGGPLGQAAAHLFHATVLWGRNRYKEAIESLTSARALARDGGWPEGESCALSNLAAVHYETGGLDEAATHNLAALEIDTRIGRKVGQLLRLTNLAHIRICQGRLAEAVAHCLSSIEIERQVGYWHGIGQAHACLGEAYHLLGQDSEALACLTEALATHRRIGARGYEADTLRVLSLCGTPQARTFAAQALSLAREIGDHWIEAQTLIAQASLDLRDGDHARAIDALVPALALARRDGARHAEAQALIGLARAHRVAGSDREAIDHATQALAISQACGYHLLTNLCKEILPLVDERRSQPA